VLNSYIDDIKMNLAGVILAGGKSSRMGRDKSKLMIGKNSLLQHSQQLLKDTGIKHIYISGNAGIKDQDKNKGPVSGIYSCLQNLEDYDYIIFIPVDMPLINKYVILKLISMKNLSAIYFKNHFLPLLINNNHMNRKIIAQQLHNHKLSINNMLKQINADSIDSHFPETTFLNANTPEEWLAIKKILPQ
jgi:molybdopterin-guanine dinucleotide biosynthesis protein A